MGKKDNSVSSGKDTDVKTRIPIEIFDEIFFRISEGESLLKICKSSHMPPYSTLYRTISNDAELREKFILAKDVGLEKHADEIREICDEDIAYNDHAAVQKQRLRIDTRKWLLSKLAPKKFGDKVDVNHGGQEDNPLQIHTIQRVIIDPKNLNKNQENE